MQAFKCEIDVADNGRELMEHGSALFPVAPYHVEMTDIAVPWHWHDDFEVAVVTEGSIVFAAEQERITLHTGDGCLFNADVLHSAWNVECGTPCRMHSIVFHPRLIGGSAESVFWQKYLLPMMENRSFQILALRAEENRIPLLCIENAWRACVEEREGFEFVVRHELSSLFLATHDMLPSEMGKPSAKKVRDEQRMKCMLTYIREHLADALTVEGVAAAASVSVSECIRCFHNMVGTTPIRYAIQLRLQKAAELLAESDEKIVEIGMDCGFQEMGYFARVFRRQYGVTPSEYRKLKKTAKM